MLFITLNVTFNNVSCLRLGRLSVHEVATVILNPLSFRVLEATSVVSEVASVGNNVWHLTCLVISILIVKIAVVSGA